MPFQFFPFFLEDLSGSGKTGKTSHYQILTWLYKAISFSNPPGPCPAVLMDFPPVRDWPGFPHQHYPPRAALQWWEQLPVRHFLL